MASIRLRAANTILKNLTRVNRNNNVRFTFHRENHVLSGSFSRTFPALRNASAFQIIYRLEHSAVTSKEASDEGSSHEENNVQSESPKSITTEDSLDDTKADSRSSDVVNSSFDESMLPDIPETPGVTSFIEEPTLQSLGLGGMSPSGIVQQILEYIHVSYDMPWWACITVFTVVVKILLFPWNVKVKREMINLQNNMPIIQKLQTEMSEARMSGNYYEAARASQQFSQILREKQLNPLKAFLGVFIQAPVFISVFFALRNMADIHNFTSFQTGGILWFTDLSVPDQFFILPLLTSLTVWATIKYGITFESAVPRHFRNLIQTYVLQIVQYGIPVIVFLFSMKFPSGLLCYWTVSNFFTLGQTYLLSFKGVKKFFKIPEQIQMTQYPSKKLGVIEGFKESMTNLKISREIEQRAYLNAVKFEKIGKEPARRTFKFDPTKAEKFIKTKEK